MIQRKQTIFLVLAVLLALAVVFLRLRWIDVLQCLTAVISGYAIFQYKKRIFQARLCIAAIVTVLFWYVGVAVLESQVTTIEALPMVEAILILMARKGILDDEKLVQSMDRIR